MTIITTINQEQQIIEHVCTGRVTFRDFEQAFDKAMQMEGFHGGMNVLWDLNHAKIEAAPEEIQELVTFVALRRQSRGTGYKLAIVADERIQHMLADIFKALASPLSFEIAIFLEENSARQWLQS